MAGFARRIIWTIAALAAFSMTAASQTKAQDFAARYFPDKTSCYARVYSAAHLKAHPQQTVTRFSVRRAADGTTMNRPGGFEVDASFSLKNNSDVYAARGICAPFKDRPSDGAACGVEGDGGSFELHGVGDSVTVRISERMQVEGGKSFSPNIAEGDNRVIKLYPAKPAACP